MTKGAFMNNEKINQQYFINRLSSKEQHLFRTDPKQFRVLYYKKLTNIVKQDLIKMVEFVTPVYELVNFSDWYDSWNEEFFWYKIEKEYQKDAMNLFKIYCPLGTARMPFTDGLKLEAKNTYFFNLLRVVYYYTNYTNKEMWAMPHIQTLHKIGHDQSPRIVNEDFVKKNYNLKTRKYKMLKTKTEIGKMLQQGCEKIAEGLINKQIALITNMNKQIKAAKATLARYGTELVRGY